MSLVVASYIRSGIRLLLSAALLLPAAARAALEGVAAPVGLAGGNALELEIWNILNVFLVLVAIVALVVIIIGGVMYIISLGDESKTEKAKNTILYGIVGLIVVGLAAVIVNFVLRAVPG